MEANVNFSNDLKVSYLSLLAKYDQQEEFAKTYDEASSYLADAVDRTTDVDMLSKLKDIIDYKKAVAIEKGMSK